MALSTLERVPGWFFTYSDKKNCSARNYLTSCSFLLFLRGKWEAQENKALEDLWEFKALQDRKECRVMMDKVVMTLVSFSRLTRYKCKIRVVRVFLRPFSTQSSFTHMRRLKNRRLWDRECLTPKHYPAFWPTKMEGSNRTRICHPIGIAFSVG